MNLEVAVLVHRIRLWFHRFCDVGDVDNNLAMVRISGTMDPIFRSHNGRQMRPFCRNMCSASISLLYQTQSEGSEDSTGHSALKRKVRNEKQNVPDRIYWLRDHCNHYYVQTKCCPTDQFISASNN